MEIFDSSTQGHSKSQVFSFHTSLHLSYTDSSPFEYPGVDFVSSPVTVSAQPSSLGRFASFPHFPTSFVVK